VDEEGEACVGHERLVRKDRVERAEVQGERLGDEEVRVALRAGVDGALGEVTGEGADAPAREVAVGAPRGGGDVGVESIA